MIQISRALIRQFRAALRRSVFTGSRSSRFQVPVVFDAGPQGVTIQSHLDGIAIAHHTDGNQESELLAVPANALEDFEGRGHTVVTLEANGTDYVLARWEDSGVPREQGYERPKLDALPPFPKLPDRFTENEPGLLKALDDAMQTVAATHLQFATHNIQLRGQSGEIVATDGRQLLLQTGFQFPWTENVLVPRVNVFGHDLDRQSKVGIAVVEDHVCVQTGLWTVWLAIDKEGRFPKYENVTPALSACTTHLRLSADDAAFLSRTLPSLPGAKDECPAVTMDLNGQVVVRARAADQNRATAVVLGGSSATGSAIRFVLKRQHLARALELGFADMHIVNPDMPATCTGARGKYVFTNLNKEAVLAPKDNDIRICSGADQPIANSNNQPSIPRSDSTMRSTPPNAAPEINNGLRPANGTHQPSGNGQSQAIGNGTESNGQHAEKSGFHALLEEAQALQTMLRDALNRTNQLIGGLKQYRRHAKTMQTTLTALRQLEPVEA